MSQMDSVKIEPIDLSDCANVRHALDDGVIRVVTGVMEYPHDRFVDNTKLALGAVTIAVAAAAHVLPGKFADHWWLLLGCVVAFAVLSTITTLFTMAFEKRFFLQTHPHPDGGAPLKVESRMARYSTLYSLHVQEGDSRSYDSDTLDVATVFHSNGYLNADKFEQWVLHALSKKAQGTSKKLQ